MEKYNQLTVLRTYTVRDSKNRSRKKAWVQCECGTEKECDYHRVKSGVTKSCGCRKSQATIEFNKTKNKKDSYIGNQYITNEGCLIRIIDYVGRNEVTVEFIDYDYKTVTSMCNIKKGQVKNPYLRTIFGIGYYGNGKYTARVNNVKTDAYIRWYCMFNRCYNETFQLLNSHYIGCTVDETFHCFQDFAKWFEENIYEFDEELEVDKDLMVDGNRVYSKDTCCIIPKKLNNAIKHNIYDRDYIQSLYKEYNGRLPTHIMNRLKELF